MLNFSESDAIKVCPTDFEYERGRRGLANSREVYLSLIKVKICENLVKIGLLRELKQEGGILQVSGER